MNPFTDQKLFMQACEQTTDSYNQKQFKLYKNLLEEELDELFQAQTATDELDALIDIMVVAIGAIHSMGANGEAAWDEVMKTNFAKVDWATRKVVKRQDGKVLKPPGWAPPNLAQFVQPRNTGAL
jgi:predicted HAD superfamily Cof-like phosphohydrolase